MTATPELTAEKPRKTTRIQAANREKILAAALEVFSRFGFRGTTIDQIAEAAGMSKSNLLYYFRSKKGIYKAVLEEILDAWLKPLRTLDVDGDPAVEIGDYIARKLELSATNPEASRLFANEMLEGAPMIMDVLTGPLRRLVDAKAEVIRAWIAQGKIVPVDPYHLVFMIWATTQHYADFDTQIRALTDSSIAQPEVRATAASTLTTIFLRGILPRQG